MRGSPIAVAFIVACTCGCSSPAPKEEEKPQAAQEKPLSKPLDLKFDKPLDTAPSKPFDFRPVIVAFGNSLTAGFGADPGKSYPDFLQQELDRRGYKYNVINAGVSGETSSDGLERLNDVLALKPEIVILELGANDGLRGLPVTSTEANLDRIIFGLQQQKIRVALAAMDLPRNYGMEYISQFSGMYANIARQYKVTKIPFMLAGVAGNPKLMQNDGLHPNAAGNAIVAATVFKYLAPELKK
jgi:acyl-CoA thioesterase-1